MLHSGYCASLSGYDRFLTGHRVSFARSFSIVFAIVLLGVCATSRLAHAEAALDISAPAAISDIYSDMNMHVQLATTKGVGKSCVGDECALNAEFDQQVQKLGASLSAIAFEAYPDLKKRIQHFNFVVAEKKEPGTISNAAGTIVILRGVQSFGLEEQSLAFVIAREMARVIDGQHDKNTGMSILVSVLVSVLFPAANVLHAFQGSAAVANATSSTVATTAASSATSLLGSHALQVSVHPDQLREADSTAMHLLKGLGWDAHDIADNLEASTQINEDGAWAKDFHISVEHIKMLAQEATVASSNSEANLLNSQITQNMEASPGASGGSDTKSGYVLDANNKSATSEFVMPSAKEAKAGEVKIEEQKAPIEVQVDDDLMEKAQVPDAAGAQAVKTSEQAKQTKVTKKIAPSRTLNKNSGKKVSKVATKTTPKKAAANLVKAPVSSKQKNDKNLYAAKSSKSKLGMNTTPKAKPTPASINPASVKSSQDDASQAKI